MLNRAFGNTISILNIVVLKDQKLKTYLQRLAVFDQMCHSRIQQRAHPRVIRDLHFLL